MIFPGSVLDARGARVPLSAEMTFLRYMVSRLLMGLLVLHIAAALKRHFLDRDDILQRMVRFR